MSLEKPHSLPEPLFLRFWDQDPRAPFWGSEAASVLLQKRSFTSVSPWPWVVGRRTSKVSSPPEDPRRTSGLSQESRWAGLAWHEEDATQRRSSWGSTPALSDCRAQKAERGL